MWVQLSRLLDFRQRLLRTPQFYKKRGVPMVSLADKELILLWAGRTSQATTLLRQIETAEPAFLSPHVYLAMADLKMKEYKDYLGEAKASAVLLQDQNRLPIITAGEKGFAPLGGAARHSGRAA